MSPSQAPTDPQLEPRSSGPSGSPRAAGRPPLNVDIVTLFPSLFQPFLETSIVGQALETGALRVRLHDLRKYTHDRYKTVDDYPFGGGAGMVMTPGPFFECLDDIMDPHGQAAFRDTEVNSGQRDLRVRPGQEPAATGDSSGRNDDPLGLPENEHAQKPSGEVSCDDPAPSSRLQDPKGHLDHEVENDLDGVVIAVMTPRGRPLDQDGVREIARAKRLVLLCGHYKGIDERVAERATHEISVGDYVLSGGELPAMLIIDAVARLLPGVVGDFDSIAGDSHFAGLLSPPEYTRPRTYRGMRVPDVLLSGDHRRIEEFKRKESIRITRERRPELLRRFLASPLTRPATTVAAGPINGDVI